MSYKKIICSVLIGFSILLFGLSYWASIDTYRDNENEKVLSASANGIDNGSNNIKVVYKSVYLGDSSKNNEEYSKVDEVIEIFDDDSIKKLSSKTLAEIVMSYSKIPYKFEGIEENVITFSKAIGRYKYEPNKFIIWIKDDYVSIFKTDEEGNISEEIKNDDINPIHRKFFKRDDYYDIKIGDEKYQYDTLEDALEGLEARFNS